MKRVEIFDYEKTSMSLPSFATIVKSDGYNGYNPDLVGGAIAHAIRHARDVAKAPHQKLDRMERVAQFVTSLRTDLSYLSYHDPRQLTGLAITERYRYWQNMLCKKALWYDIGVLEPRLTGDDVLQIKQWLAEAAMRTPQDEVNDIKAELKDAKAAIDILSNNLTSIKNISQKGEKLIEKFEKFLEQGQPVES